MAERSTLTIISNYYVGGVFNFHRNILSHNPGDAFDKKVIFLQWKGYNYTKENKGFGTCPEYFYEVGTKIRVYTKEIAELIGDEKGVVVTNFDAELAALHFYPKPNKVVVYICHDEYYVDNAVIYEFLIDAFVAHNPFFYELLIKKLPQRTGDIYYLPFGVEVTELKKIPNEKVPLDLVWLARIVVSKGIYEIPVIDDLLKEKGIPVHWTIIGDGPESKNFKTMMENRKNFTYAAPTTNKEVMNLLENQDIFVLPSRLDGLPVAMLEAMSRGIVPVMYKFNPGIKKIITDDIGFIVETGDNTSISECIGRLYHDRHLLRYMSEQARAKVVNEYDIKKRAQEYFHLYENLQPSLKKGKWKALFIVHGKEFHPLIPAFLGRMLRRFRRKFFPKKKKDSSVITF